MRATPDDEARLLAELVAIPSTSGDEGGAVEMVGRWCAVAGLPVRVDDAGIAIELAARKTGPGLALASHLDIVPAGEGWRRAPFDPSLEDGVIYGRGAADAKASVAAMLLAARDLAEAGPRARAPARAALAGRGIAQALDAGRGRAGRSDRRGGRGRAHGARLRGGPTGSYDRGAMRARHAASRRPRARARWAARAIETLAHDLVRLEGLFTSRTHPLLGGARATPTMLSAGVAAT